MARFGGLLPPRAEDRLIGASLAGSDMAADELPDTPFLRAQQQWDTRMGSAVAQAKNWRLLCFGLVLILAICLLILIGQLGKSPIKPILIEVETETGRIKRQVSLESLPFQPSEALKRHFLTQWFKDLRAIPTDLVLLTEQKNRLFAFVTTTGFNQLSDYFKHSHPFQLYQQGAVVQAEVLAINRLTQDSYQLEWKESVYNNGQRQSETLWHGTATISLQVPTDELQLKLNPIGLMVQHFDVSKFKDLA